MSGSDPAAVVAGIDGSPESRAAVDLAAWEADRRGRRLRLVHGYRAGHPEPAAVFVTHAVGSAGDRWELARCQAARVRREHPGLAVDIAVTPGDPGAVLVDESRDAALVVVGRRGSGSYYSPLLGSVAGRVAAHAHAPIIVVPSALPGWPGRHRSGVVVGVNGSAGAATAVEFAFEEAAARGGDLTAVYAWGPGTAELATARQQAESLLAEMVCGWTNKYPGVDLACRAVPSLNPLRTMLEEAGTAELVVVGAPRRGGFSSLLLGSVSDGLVHHALAPVAVVHPAGEPR